MYEVAAACCQNDNAPGDVHTAVCIDSYAVSIHSLNKLDQHLRQYGAQTLQPICTVLPACSQLVQSTHDDERKST